MGIIDFSKPKSIRIAGDDHPFAQSKSMTAPSNGIVWTVTSSSSWTSSSGDTQHHYTSYTSCSLSGYGTVVSGNDKGLFIVNKGDTITLGYHGVRHTSLAAGSATFYPFK